MSEFVIESSDNMNITPFVCLVGDTGAGKTTAMLSLPGKKLIVDAENGTKAFGDRFDFDRVASDDPVVAHEVIASLLSDPGEYQFLGIDPISTIWTRTMDIADESMRTKMRMRGQAVNDVESCLNIGNWMGIKRMNRQIIAPLRRLNMPVVVTSRAKALMEGQKRGDAFMGLIPDAEKSLLYEFDIVIWMLKLGGKRRAFVQKDRWGRLPYEIEGDVHQALLDAFPDHWGLKAKANPMAEEGQVEEFNMLVEKLGLSHADVIRALRTRSVDRFENLDPKKAEEVLRVLHIRLQGVRAMQARQEAAEGGCESGSVEEKETVTNG